MTHKLILRFAMAAILPAWVMVIITMADVVAAPGDAGLAKSPPGGVPAFAAALAHFDLEIPVAAVSGVVKIDSLTSEPSRGFADAPGYGGFFWAAGGTQMVFSVPPNGATTPNSRFPRTELSQKKSERWKPASADHVLRGTFAITSVPKITDKGEITIAQIHNDISDNGPLLKLVCDYRSKPWKLHADYRVQPKKASDNHVTPDRKREALVANRPMDFEITLTSARVLTVKVRKTGTRTWNVLADSAGKGLALDPDWDTETCYFKAGCYMFDPGPAATPAGEVRYSMLAVE